MVGVAENLKVWRAAIAMEGRGSFTSFNSYVRALAKTPATLAARAGSVSTTYGEMSRPGRARIGSDMARTLTWYDLLALGFGGMLGAGVFLTTGHAARADAGPAVVVSYAVAGLCALLSALCYTEFAVDMPVAGGAFTYLRVTFGEFAAFITGANVVMEYVVSNAAVARSFTTYLGAAIGVPASEKWRVTVPGLPDGFNQMDFVAVGVILLISVIICYGTKESSSFNIVLTAMHIGLILFIIVIGFCKGEWKNLTTPSNPSTAAGGFFPYGASGVFNGAATVYLSYIGYDAVSTMAEEVKEPKRDIPVGVAGSVVVVTVLYCLMAASVCMLVPYDAIKEDGPLTTAFRGLGGWRWVSNIVSLGAAFGILTSLLVSMLGQARYLCVIGRSNVLPAWFAHIHPATATPVNASAFLAAITATLALFTSLQVLLNLVSIGTLFVFYMVANALVFRRYAAASTTPLPTLAFLAAFSAVSLAFTLLWKFAPPGFNKCLLLSVCMVATVVMVQAFRAMVSEARKPDLWVVPAMPWVPAVSIFLNVFLLGSLDGPSYVRFGIFTAVAVAVYLLYSVHASYDAEEDVNGEIRIPACERIGGVGDVYV